ncbi:cytidine deaminase [Pinibacter soli]|uniref:Cytidine deaminase n=1 Tax=Pinibacter soli TaxID=3044211 RepID=A0ABT6RD46_9BACT|nr:cytidine deaminase [Pinibacter soli]MDI3320401.1 cytidine deaminase [Pinibacter soli]
MEQKHINLVFEKYNSINELQPDDALLLRKAIDATGLAYAPYSKFNVGAAAKLANGEIVVGANQENASYPVGICAERTLLSAASSLFPNVAIDTMAISYKSTELESDHPITPCGVCRQTLHEFQLRVKQSMRLILAGEKGEVYILSDADILLPLSFSATDLQ